MMPRQLENVISTSILYMYHQLPFFNTKRITRFIIWIELLIILFQSTKEVFFIHNALREASSLSIGWGAAPEILKTLANHLTCANDSFTCPFILPKDSKHIDDLKLFAPRAHMSHFQKSTKSHCKKSQK